MKYTHYIFSALITALLTSSCERKPKACLDLPEVLEAGSTLTIESCSQHYEFLTWEFSDDRGYIANTVERQFEDESSFNVVLTAYSDGAFRSDEVSHAFKTSYRFVDRFEIAGESSFSGFEATFAGVEDASWSAGGGTGTFTDEAPFVINVWPAKEFRLLNEQIEIVLFGRQGNSRSRLGDQQFNFASFKDNPVVFEAGNNYKVKMYWTFRY